jgi:cell division protein FtsB
VIGGLRSSENIKVKTDELRAKFEEIKKERARIDQEIRDLQAKS